MKKQALTLSMIVLTGAAYAFPSQAVYSSASGPNTCFTTITGGTDARIVNNLNANLGGGSSARIVPSADQRVREGREFKLADICWFNYGGGAATTNIQLGLTFRGGTANGNQIGQGLVDFDMSWTGNGLNQSKTASFTAGPKRSQVILGNEVYTLEITRAYSQTVNYCTWGNAEVYGRLTQAVPEPTTMAALGLGGLALVRRKKKA